MRPIAGPAHPTHANPMRTRAMRILCVEEEPLQRKLLGACIELIAGEPLFAASGREAVAIFREHAVDLILLDMNQPAGDGFSALNEIRHLGLRATGAGPRGLGQHHRPAGIGLSQARLQRAVCEAGRTLSPAGPDGREPDRGRSTTALPRARGIRQRPTVLPCKAGEVARMREHPRRRGDEPMIPHPGPFKPQAFFCRRIAAAAPIKPAPKIANVAGSGAGVGAAAIMKAPSPAPITPSKMPVMEWSPAPRRKVPLP